MTKIPQEIIAKAVEGGWTAGWGDMRVFTPKAAAQQLDLEDWQWIALDKNFWQALERALGWEPTHPAFQASWVNNAHRFFDLILQEKETDSFWQNLLDSK